MAKSVEGKTVSAEAFVEAFVKCATVEEMTAATGMDRPRIIYRAALLRKRGVNLPQKFPAEKGGKKLDVAALNLIVEKATAPAAPEAGKKGKK